MFDIVVHREIRLEDPRKGSCGFVRRHLRAESMPLLGERFEFDDGSESAEIALIASDRRSYYFIELRPASYPDEWSAIRAKEEYRKRNWVIDEDVAENANLRFRF